MSANGDKFGLDTNYFTCTLGEAAEYNARKPSEFTTINKLIDIQSSTFPDHLAVGFPVPRGNASWKHEIFSTHVSSFDESILIEISISRPSQGLPRNCIGVLCSVRRPHGEEPHGMRGSTMYQLS